MADVTLTFDTVARLLLVVLALLWVVAMARQSIADASRRRMHELLVILKVDTSGFMEAIRRATVAAAEFQRAMGQLREVTTASADSFAKLADGIAKANVRVGPAPPNVTGTLRDSGRWRKP